MKNSPAKVRILLLSALVFLIICYFYDGFISTLFERHAPPPMEGQRANSSESSNQESAVTSGGGLLKPQGMPEADWERAKRMHSMFKMANKPIDFYCQLIDQHGLPVAGAQLQFRILRYSNSFQEYLSKGDRRISERLVATTDQKGLVRIEQKEGIELSIEKILKEGYERPGRGVAYSYIYNNISSGEVSNMYHEPKPSSPVVIQLWKKGLAEPLINTAVELRIDPNKGWHTAYYEFALKSKVAPEPGRNWELKVSGNHESPKFRDQNPDWEIVLTAAEGCGLQFSTDPHGNLAPEDGYVQSLTFNSANQAAHLAQPFRRVYFRGKDGRKYATFRLDFDFGGKNRKGLIAVYLHGLRINPNASRNLEYDPAKEIR